MKDSVIAICQLPSDVGTEDYDPREANLARALKSVDEAAGQGAQMMVFGEAYLNGYESAESTWRYAVGETADDPFVGRLAEECAKRQVTVIMGATTHKGTFPGDVYNSALVIGPDGVLGTYSKTHVGSYVYAGDLLVKEKCYWSTGDSLPVFDTQIGKVGVEICYDVWFPEVARTLTLKGAELIINVSAALAGFEEFWDHMLYARSTENCVWYMHASVVGMQRGVELFGGSRLFDPFGKVVAEAPRGSEALQLARVSADELRRARGTLHPFANRKPALYELGAP
jgi:predicted amidohydrolase